jgi:hypothetical protein
MTADAFQKNSAFFVLKRAGARAIKAPAPGAGPQSIAPIDRIGRISIAASEPKAGSDSTTDPMKFATVWIGAITESLCYSFKKAPAIARIERRRRGAQHVKVLGCQLEHGGRSSLDRKEAARGKNQETPCR